VTLRERLHHLARAEEDEGYRAALLTKFIRDPAFFMSCCLWTFDPRKAKHKRYMPFLLFARQEEFINEAKRAMEIGYDFGAEKSRDTGVTWCVLGLLLHSWLFEMGFAALIGSRKVDSVDKAGDPSSHFYKLMFMVENLPSWLVPPGWTGKQPWRTYLKMENPFTRSVITGESANEDFGRGGRYKVVFPDEFAAWEWAAAAWTSCGESTECRLPVSTPRGMNFFGRLMNPRNKENAMAKFRLHWKDDPRHGRTEIDPRTNKQFYPYEERARKRYDYDTTMLAQEIEIDYNRSVKGRVYPTIDYVGLGRYKYDPMLPTYAAWDFGRTDETAIGWYQWDNLINRWRMIDYYQSSGKLIEFFVPFFTGVIPTGVDWTYTDIERRQIEYHRGWRVDEQYGDPAGRQRNQVTNTSVLEELSRPRPGLPNGIEIFTNSRAVQFETRMQAARKLMLRLDVDEDRCNVWLDAMRNAHFPEMSEGSNSTAEPRKPVHDWTSHGRSMFEYLAVNERHTGGIWTDPEDAASGYVGSSEEYEDELDPIYASRGISGY